MTRLYVLVEGQTEEQFVRTVLEPHLRGLRIWTQAVIVETNRDAFGRKRRGGGRWKHWLRDLKRLTGQQSGPDVRFTTLFDLYGLPDDFPDLDKHGADPDTARRADALALAMARVVEDHRLIPYLQRHEMEALVLASLDALEELLPPEDTSGVTTLRGLLAASTPEDINDGAETAPSKRLLACLPSYRKTLHGPLAIEATGLSALRRSCPRFNAWLAKLESLGETTALTTTITETNLQDRPARGEG